MSCYEWESGTLKLPTAEFTKVKKAVLDAAISENKIAYNKTQEFWKLLPAAAKRNPDTYRKWMRAFLYGNDSSDKWNYDPKVPAMQPLNMPVRKDRYGYVVDNSATEVLVDEVSRVLSWVCFDKNGNKPRRALQTDMPKPTNRTTSFDVGGEASITFNRETSTVAWDVGENNHACERAHGYPLAQVFFTALNRVNWTRGSGGTIVGNNEYNRDNRESGGGGNYVVMEFGPKKKQAVTAGRYQW